MEHKFDQGQSTGKQISAGAVIFRKTENGVEVAMIATRGGRIWGLPKGLQRPGETLARTVHREVQEETGLRGKILRKIDSIHYWYSHKEHDFTVRRFKIVYFFLMQWTGGDTSKHDERVDEVCWFPLAEAVKKSSYDSEREIIKRAGQIILESTDTGSANSP